MVTSSSAGELSLPLQNVKTYLFDLDGTVLDSLPGIQESFQFLLDNFLQDEKRTAEDLLYYVGRPLEYTMGELSGKDPRLAQILVSEYRKHNVALLPQQPLYPGAKETIQALRDAGMKTGIVTSKARDSAMISIETHKLEPLLDIILTKEDCHEHKPKPLPLLYACRLLGVKSVEAAYVGDSTYDMQAAQAAGCVSIAAMWGAIQPDLIMATNPTHTVNTFEELKSLAISSN